MIKRITAKEANKLANENTRYNHLLESAYIMIESSSKKGLYEWTYCLSGEKMPEVVMLMDDLEANGFNIKEYEDDGTFFKKATEYKKIVIEWRDV